MYLRPPSGTNNQIERCSAKSDRFDALRLLGASIGIQLVSSRVVFVEGPSDKEILERLYADYGDRLSFVETKGLSTWSSLSRVIPELIDKVTAYESTYLIRDRDLLTDAEVAETETRFKGKVFVWRRRGIENYLLDPTTILKVLNRLNIKNLTSIDQVTGALRHLADEMKTNVLLDIIAFELNRETSSPLRFPRLSSGEDFESTVMSVLESKKQRILARLEREKLDLETKKRDLDEIWSSRWLELVDGKELLQTFINRYIGPEARPLDLTHFRNLLVAEMRASGAIPEDIRRVMDVVVQGIR
jgi:hypothetical protein